MIMIDYKERTISFEELPFGKASIPLQNALEKYTTKTEF